MAVKKKKVSDERLDQMMMEMLESMTDFNDEQIIAMHAAMVANRVKDPRAKRIFN